MLLTWLSNMSHGGAKTTTLGIVYTDIYGQAKKVIFHQPKHQ